MIAISAQLANYCAFLGWSIPRRKQRTALTLLPVMPVRSKHSVPEVDHGRLVHRSFHANYLERVKNYHQTPAYQKAMRKRKVWVEPLFAEAKDCHGLRRFRLRLLWRVNCEALRIAAGQNLKRLLKKRGWGRRPFPVEALCASFWGRLPEVLVLVLEVWSFQVPIGSASSMVRMYCLSLC